MKSKIPIHWYIFGVIATIYWFSRNPYVSFGDSIGFLYYASLGFDLATNSTSHFLYQNICHLLLLPEIGNPVDVLTASSIFFMLACLYRMYQLILITGRSQIDACLSVIVMALGFTCWRQAGTIEVYAMCLWLGAEILLAMGKDVYEKKSKRIWQVAIWMGLALLTHIQFLLLIPAAVLYWSWGRQTSLWQKMGPFFLMLLVSSPLLILPLVFDTHPVSSVFSDQSYQTQVFQIELKSLLIGGLRSLGYLIYNFHVFLPILLIGVWKSWQSQRFWTLLLLLAAAPLWGFAMKYTVTDNYVFFLLPYLSLCILGSAGWTAFTQLIKPFVLRIALVFCIGPLLYVSAWQIAEEIPALQTFAIPKQYKGGLRYYFWPGQSHSTDPLQLAQDIQEGKREMIPDFDRYEQVLEYLQLLEK